MDPGIWSRLPPELVEHVLSFLPLKTLLKLRSTCKHFNSLIYNPSSFISKSRRPLSHHLSFLVLSHPQYYQQYPLYDSILGSWRRSSLSTSPLLPSDPSPPVLLSASNGLFCLSLPNTPSSFVVCNFLTKSSRKIKFPMIPFPIELLTFVSTSTGYKILVISTRSVFLYDSRSHSWQQFTTSCWALSDKQGVYFNSSFYFTTPSPPFSVVRFNPDEEEEEETYCGPELPRDLTFVRLVSDGEKKLYVVGGIGMNGISRSLKVWEVVKGGDSGGVGVVEVAKLPELMCRKLMSVCYHNYEHVYCFWHQGMICICCYTWPEILYYKTARNTWHWLPKCPSLTDKWSCGFRWFSFLPDISAVV